MKESFTMAMLVRVCSASHEGEGCRSSKRAEQSEVGWGWAVKESFWKEVYCCCLLGIGTAGTNWYRLV